MNPRDYRPEPGSHAGRMIVVTGAGDGIGRALALALAQQGATVGLLGRTLRKLEATYDRIVGAGGPQPALLPFNLETAAAGEYEALSAALGQEFGRVDGLAHVAGIAGDPTPLDHYDVPTWCRVLHVNLTAPFVLTQALLPLLRRAADASVVFTACAIGRQGRAYYGAYAASKSGLEGLMQVLAHECEGTTNIRANSLDPGPVRTALRLRLYPAEDRTLLPEPEAVTAPFLYLLGPASRGVNGQAISAG